MSVRLYVFIAIQIAKVIQPVLSNGMGSLGNLGSRKEIQLQPGLCILECLLYSKINCVLF